MHEINREAMQSDMGLVKAAGMWFPCPLVLGPDKESALGSQGSCLYLGAHPLEPIHLTMLNFSSFTEKCSKICLLRLNTHF